MPPKSSRKLAGCIAIELALAAACLGAAGPEYLAGTATAGGVTALALEDRYGNPAVVAQSDQTITRAIADFIAARLLESAYFPRQALVLGGNGAAQQPAQSEDYITAVSAALARLAPAQLVWGPATLSVTTADNRCLASVTAAGTLSLEGCTTGMVVRAPIRSAFQVVDVTHGLQQRRGPLRTFSVQAIAFGKQVTILAVGGGAGGIRSPAQIVIPFANDSSPLDDDPRIAAAIRSVLTRVGKTR